MSDAARVTSLEALRRFRAAFAEFGDEARLALSSAESDVQRAVAWVTERATHWHHEIRRRERKLAEAKSELYRAEMAAREERPSCVLERRMVARAQEQVDEARQKLERCKHWIRAFDREIMLFKGKLQPLASHIDRDVAKGLARLATMLDRLEAYVRLAPPSVGRVADEAGSGDRAPDAGEAPA